MGLVEGFSTGNEGENWGVLPGSLPKNLDPWDPLMEVAAAFFFYFLFIFILLYNKRIGGLPNFYQKLYKGVYLKYSNGSKTMTSQTQTQTQTQLVKIDLSELYEFVSWRTMAIDITKSILENIDKDKSPYQIYLEVNESPDVGIIIRTNRTPYSDEEIIDMIMEKQDIEETIKHIAQVMGADLVIELYDGYETGYTIIA